MELHHVKLIPRGAQTALTLVVPESVAALPMFAELVVDDTATAAPESVTRSELEIVVGVSTQRNLLRLSC